MLTLYSAKNTAALPVHFVLEEIQVDYKIITIDFKKTEQKQVDYLAVNPKGRVPSLVTEHGTLTETAALLTYLAMQFPQAGLMPKTPYDFARVQEFMGYMASTVHIAFAHKLRGARWSDDVVAHESMQRKVASNLKDCAHLIENYYIKGPWIMGSEYTICDPYLYLIGFWLDRCDIDIKQYPKLSSHNDALRARPAVSKVLAFYN